MDPRKTLTVTFALVVASFFLGRFTSGGSTFLAASNTEMQLNKGQQVTLKWLQEANPLDFATYKVSYLERPFDESSGKQELVKFIAGNYRLPAGSGYSHIDATSRGDLDGDGIEEGAAVKLGNYGGTGHFPELVVLKKTDIGFVEFASTTEPIEFFYDRIDIRSVRIVDKMIIVNIIGKGPDDAGCCPTVPMEKQFRLIGGKIQEVN